MQLGQTSTSELLPAAETSQENVQGVAEVRNISHLLREPHARQCLRHRVKHLNQTTRTESAYASTTSFNKNPPNYNKNVRNCNPLAGVENFQQTCYRRGGRSTSHGRRQSKVPLRRWNMFELCANGLTMCRDRGQAHARCNPSSKPAPRSTHMLLDNICTAVLKSD